MHHKIDRRRKTGREEETREPQATSSLQPKSGSERRGSRDEWMQEVGSRDAHQATTAKQSNGSATDADRRREREEACDRGRKKRKETHERFTGTHAVACSRGIRASTKTWVHMHS